MLRDLVCDEETNTANCLYDGGDCCLEAKVRRHCRNCSCILSAKPERLDELFYTWDVKTLVDSQIIDPDNVFSSWTVIVDEVISEPVCAILCLDHKQGDRINGWHYNDRYDQCRCGWTKPIVCQESLQSNKSNRWTLTSPFTSSGHIFVMLSKTLPCGKHILEEHCEFKLCL